MTQAADRRDGRQARPVRAGGITPRLAEILARMAEAALDAEDAACATRGKVLTRRPGAPPGRRPLTRRGAAEVQP